MGQKLKENPTILKEENNYGDSLIVSNHRIIL